MHAPTRDDTSKSGCRQSPTQLAHHVQKKDERAPSNPPPCPYVPPPTPPLLTSCLLHIVPAPAAWTSGGSSSPLVTVRVADFLRRPKEARELASCGWVQAVAWRRVSRFLFFGRVVVWWVGVQAPSIHRPEGVLWGKKGEDSPRPCAFSLSSPRRVRRSRTNDLALPSPPAEKTLDDRRTLKCLNAPTPRAYLVHKAQHCMCDKGVFASAIHPSHLLCGWAAS